MQKHFVFLGLLAAACTSAAVAQQGPVPTGIPRLNHVFVIMMENHGYPQIINNPSAPFTNAYAKAANLATNYFAVAHPSLTNYLEVVGGSNFGVLDDNAPDWHNAKCSTNLSTGIPNTEADGNPICPIGGMGTDAATPAIDFTNETQGPPGAINIDGTHSYAANPQTLGITIADQLVQAGKNWKSYQEDLPLEGADTINYSDGIFTNNTDFTKISPRFTNSNVVQQYAVKHNPFAYFQVVQEGANPSNSLSNIVPFEGDNGLFADLRSGKVPELSFIAPNQCHDQHGRGNGGPFCAFDFKNNGTQKGLNPALILSGDVTVEKLVTAIHNSPVWSRGRNAIVLVWDENDYSLSPIINQVVLVVDTNYGFRSLQSGQYYTHFSLLKSLEAAFGLPCLNHACDASTSVMSDVFAIPPR
jgi:phospholipase C